MGLACQGRTVTRVLSLCARPRMSLSESKTWNQVLNSQCEEELPCLAYPCVAHSVQPTKGSTAMHEEQSFNEVIFVNHSTSQTWPLPENEQFCIKWSISVNGEGLTSLGCSANLVKWNNQGCAWIGRRCLYPRRLCLTSQCIKWRKQE